MAEEEKSLKERWIEALRSGKYEQTTGRLRNSKGFCCLGVLCDVKNPNGWYQGDKYFVYRGHYSTVPRDLWSEVGILQEQATLAVWNDVDQYSFNEIALKLEELP